MTHIQNLISGAIVGAACCLSTPAMAQSADFANQTRGTEARLSISVPFGTERTDAAAQPKLAFAMRQYNDHVASDFDWMQGKSRAGYQATYQESTLALTLTDHPAVLLNGQDLQINFESEAGVSDDAKTAGKVALVAGAVAVVVVGGLLIAVAACSTDGEDPKC